VHFPQALRRDLLVSGFLPGQQPGIGVAHDHRASDFSQAGYNLGRLRPALHGITEADDLVDRVLLHIGQRCIQRRAIAVNV
jgi:hypothetical protein